MKLQKLAQMKSSFYYIFWGICSVAVVAGQIYIGSGYHNMSNSVQDLIQHAKQNNP